MIRRLRRHVAAAVTALAVAGAGSALHADQAGPLSSANPIDCWSRTSTGAVRVGETFTYAVTCAAAESDAFKVVIDQSSLDPSALHVAPFEVLGGTSAADEKSGDRHFFQFVYTLRLIADDAFGKDVKIPEVVVPFRIQTRVGGDTSIEGRDHQYILPSHPVRILSLVPLDAPDIRDGSAAAFADLEERTFRANALAVASSVLFALAALAALVFLARLFRRDRPAQTEASRQPAAAAVLRAVGGDLDDVWRQRQQAGWTPALIGRALAGLRVVGAFAIGRQVALKEQAPVDGVSDDEGVLRLPGGWLDRRPFVVSSPLTAHMVRQAGAGRAAGTREPLAHALNALTEARYGSSDKVDAGKLDEALQFGIGLERRLRREHFGPVKQYRAVAEGLRTMGARVWSR